MDRKGRTKRKTKETEINIELEIDGSGRAEIETGMPFFNHMLDSFTRHGLFDIRIQAKGDLEVDYHHTVEDVGLALGQTFKDALGDKYGIRRFGEASCPLDETLARVVVDLMADLICLTTSRFVRDVWEISTPTCRTSFLPPLPISWE